MRELMILDTLRTIRFLDDLNDEDRHKLAAMARLERYPPETFVFREGERPGRIFLVAEGSAALEIRLPEHGGRRIQIVGPGELLGWSPLLGPFPMTASARTLSPSRLIVLDAPQLLALCHHDPRFGFALMRRTATALAQRLSATRLQLLDVYRHQLHTVAGIHDGAD
jgi:CRP-like cAMP-binding protein